MKRSKFDETRDERVANDVAVDRRLMCGASGCPNAWSVSRESGRGLCSAHAWSEPHLWPRITQEQLDAQADRARYAAAGRAETPPMTAAQKREVLAKLLQASGSMADAARSRQASENQSEAY